jgi:hypothetical protein
MSLTHIQTIELGSSQASIEFTSIPQDYDDLKILISARSDRSPITDEMNINMNANASNQSSIIFRKTTGVSNLSTTTIRGADLSANSTTASTFTNSSNYISNYTAAVAKSVSTDYASENNGSENRMGIIASLWDDTSAVTSIVLDCVNGNFVTGSTFSLYGVTAGGDGTVTTA